MIKARPVGFEPTTYGLEARSFSAAPCRWMTVRATSALEVLRISKEHFLKLLSDFPEMAVEIMRVLADRLNHTTAELSAARAAKKPEPVS